MKWLKDKTYFFCKWNTQRLQNKILENTYTKELKEKMKLIGELQEETDYYKAKYQQRGKKNKELKEMLNGKNNIKGVASSSKAKRKTTVKSA